MKLAFVFVALLATSIAHSATPINGWYAGVFGGYAYLPNNINTARQSLVRSNATFFPGYNAGGSVGFKSNPMRYEAELAYVNANLKNFSINNVQQTGVSGYNDAILGLAKVYYDFPNLLNCIQPFIGVGVGYGWVQATLDSTGNVGSTQQTTHYSGSNSVAAYQATTGLTYNFAENYALNLGYRYQATAHVSNLGSVFQAHLASLGVLYRFDGNNYK